VDRPEPRRPIRITCAPGLRPWLSQETEALGFSIDAKDHTGVEIKGRLTDAMRCALRLRTAYHVLQRFADVYAKDPDELYEAATRLPWERVVPADGYVSVDSVMPKGSPHNSMFVNVRIKDAIVDRINRERGQRPDSGPRTDRAVINAYWADGKCRLSLSISGRKLSDRGYRKLPFKAPMRETIAAAVLMETGYDGTRPLVVPMCGSGTIAIEAALIASHRAPGLLRSTFGVQHLVTFDPALWQAERAAALALKAKTTPAIIVASDISPEAVEAARKNALTAGVDHLIDFHVCDFAETPMPAGTDDCGTIILHGEYGERMGDRDELQATYGRIGDFLKQECGGWGAYVFTSREFSGAVGLKPAQRTPFEHGGLDCRLLRFEVYAGSRT
jgi:putative N6-adenine-specific DNA methylase